MKYHIQYRRQLTLWFPVTPVFLPNVAPIIEAIIVSIHPLQTRVHVGIPEASGGSLQKKGSIKAARINCELIIKGTYQILLGFCSIINKQAIADNKPKGNMQLLKLYQMNELNHQEQRK